MDTTSKSMAFARDVKEVRKRLKMTQSEFAQAVGVEQATISRWESGIEPTWEKFRLLLSFFTRQGIPLKSIQSYSDITDDEETRILDSVDNQIPVIGSLSEDHKILPIQPKKLKKDGFEIVAYGPTHRTVKTVAVVEAVNWDGHDSSLFYYFENNKHPLSHYDYGKLCFCEIKGSGILLRRVVPSQQNQRYHLLSHRFKPIFDAELLWAAKVTWMFQA